MNKITIKVSGISFAIEQTPSLKHLEILPKEEVSLLPEPENQYDPKAIKIEYKGIKIGYVPRKQEGFDFSSQSWCHDYIDIVQANIEEVWYEKNGTFIPNFEEGAELVGISVVLKTPHLKPSNDDVIISKASLSEPEIIVDFNETKHIYNMRLDGGYKTLQGGTTFIKRYYDPFDSERVARQCSKYWGVSANDIEKMWQSNGNISGLLGTLIHLALEHYINFEKVGDTITKTRQASGKDVEGNYAMPKHPFLKQVIESLGKLTEKLDKKHNVEQVVAEALITDSATGWGGLVDRLAIIDSKKKIARVQDYKVNINATKEEGHSKPKPPFSHLPANKLTKYALQMSFYSALLMKHGWTIEGLDVFIYESRWVHYELDLINFPNFEEDLRQEKKIVDKFDPFL